MTWLQNWKSRKSITIIGSADGILTNFQIKETVTYIADMNADFSDLRFTSANGNTLLSYWIESKTDGSTADVWIKIPSIPKNPSTVLIWMYYSNAVASDIGSGSDTFLQYHGAATAAYHDTNTVLNNIVYESKIKATAATHRIYAGVSKILGTTDDHIYIQSYSGVNLRLFATRNGGASHTINETPDWPEDTYVKLKIIFDGTTANGYVDDNEISTGITSVIPNENLGLWLYIDAGTVVQDWSFVRKYTVNEPTTSMGTAVKYPVGRIVETRCIIQSKGASDKYYPKVMRVDTTETFPWNAAMASIIINTNTSDGTAGYMSPIRNDDIVRLQVNIRSSDREKSVWQNIFEGRLMKVRGSFSSTVNTTTLICRGHGEELLYRAVTGDYDPAAARTGAMLKVLVTAYLDRLTDDSLIDDTASTSIPDYNVQLDTKFMSDVVREFEALEAYGYVLKIVNSYDSNDDLDTSLVSWQPVPALSTTVQIIEGTPRFISGEFENSIENVIEDVTIYGDVPAGQYVGTSVDATPEYGTRFHVGVDMSIGSSQLCTDLADATLSRFGSGITSGSVRILGDPNIAVGDLIYVKIPSIVLDGASIDGNYRVKRLSHTIDIDGFYTDLDLGELIQTPADILAGQHTKNRLLAANFID